MSSSSAGQRFADYFAVSGLDLVTGLEADQLSGLWENNSIRRTRGIHVVNEADVRDFSVGLLFLFFF